jgi:glycosyltransferase involved in cell wall biosynthesis
MVNLANAFIGRGFAVDILLTRGGTVPYPDSLNSAVRLVDLRSGHKITAVPQLVRYLKREPPAALITAKYHSCVVALWARRWLKIPVPVYLTIRNTLTESLSRSRQRHVRRLYGKADAIIAVSQGVAEDLIAHFGMDRQQVYTIYNPILTGNLEARLAQPVDHPWLEADRSEPTLLTAGRLVPQKDHATLIRALAELRRTRPCRLVILGEGRERESLQSLARSLGVAESVDLHGMVDDPLPYMAGADLFVLSSIFEGLANVVAEALAAGTPVVSTDCPSGPREILQDGRLGALVPTRDPQALACAMDQTLAHPHDATTLRTGAEPFMTEHVADQYLSVMGLVES